MFLNVMTPLIMVISFSDSMQLTFAARDQLMAGWDKRTAFRNAILVVGPACVLTHAAAGLSLLGLLVSSSDLIRGFGEAGFLATAIALITVLSLVPTFGVLLVRDEARLVATLRAADPGVAALRRFCDWIARRMVQPPRLLQPRGLSSSWLASPSSIPASSRAIASPTRFPTRSRQWRRAAASTRKSAARIRSKWRSHFLRASGLYTPQTFATIADVQEFWRASPELATCGRSNCCGAGWPSRWG